MRKRSIRIAATLAVAAGIIAGSGGIAQAETITVCHRIWVTHWGCYSQEVTPFGGGF